MVLKYSTTVYINTNDLDLTMRAPTFDLFTSWKNHERKVFFQEFLVYIYLYFSSEIESFQSRWIFLEQVCIFSLYVFFLSLSGFRKSFYHL